MWAIQENLRGWRMNDSGDIQAGIVSVPWMASLLIVRHAVWPRKENPVNLWAYTVSPSLATLGWGEGVPVPLSIVAGGGLQEFPCIKDNIIPPKEIWGVARMENRYRAAKRWWLSTNLRERIAQGIMVSRKQRHTLVSGVWTPNCNTEHSSSSGGPSGTPCFS